MGNSSTSISTFIADPLVGKNTEQLGRSISCFCAHDCCQSENIVESDLLKTSEFGGHDEDEEVFVPPRDVFFAGDYNDATAKATEPAESAEREGESIARSSVIFDYDKNAEQVVIRMVKNTDAESKPALTKGFSNADTPASTWNLPPSQPRRYGFPKRFSSRSASYTERKLSSGGLSEDCYTVHM